MAVVAVIVAGFAVVLVGLGGGTGGSSGLSATVSPIAPGPAVARDGGGYAAPSAGAPSAVTDMAAPAPDGMPAQGVPVGGVQRSLVRTAQLTVEVDDAVTSGRRVRTAAAAVGAIVAEEQSNDGGAWLVLRVPADSLDRLVDDIAAVGRVTGRRGQVVDATEQVVDLDARVASQQASVARVRTLLAEATSIGDVVAVESELSRREAELDSLTSRLNALRDEVALSTLTVDLRATRTLVTDGDDPAPGFLDGLATGWAGLRAVGSAAAAVVGFVLPFLPVLALLAGIGWLARRVLRARRTPAVAGAGGRSGPGSEGES